MPVRGEVDAELVDERRLADAGDAGDADASRVTGMGQQLDEQLLGLFAMVGPPRLDERDRPRDRSPVPVADTRSQLPRVERGHQTASCSRSLRSISNADSAITVPGGKMAAAPAARSASKSCGGMTPPTTIMMSSRPCFASSSLSSGTRVRCPAAKELTPTIWT